MALMIKAASQVIDMMPRSRTHSALDLARKLGWFSIGLGLVEIAAPGRLARFLGVRRGGPLIALFGLREIATGGAILVSRDPTPFVWARVGGDVLDLLGLAVAATNGRRPPIGAFAFMQVALITAVDVICAQTLSADMMRTKGRSADYSGRSGFGKPAAQVRGAAKGLQVPADMKSSSYPTEERVHQLM